MLSWVVLELELELELEVELEELLFQGWTWGPARTVAESRIESSRARFHRGMVRYSVVFLGTAAGEDGFMMEDEMLLVSERDLVSSAILRLCIT